MAVPLLAAAVVLQGTSMYMQYRASRQAAAVDTATAAYNAKYDEALAKQNDLDTIQNVRVVRAEQKGYLSRQAASYASAGVLSTTGSPLASEIANAGRFEQQIQQKWVDSQQKQQEYASKAKVGILAGEAQAQADRSMGTLALLNGGANLARLGFEGYQSGIFKLGKSAPSTLPSGAGFDGE